MMVVIKGTIQAGSCHMSKRMKSYPDVFKVATQGNLIPGTINVRVAKPIPVKEDFRVCGKDIEEPEQDLLFEKCLINNFPAFRIRPLNLNNGSGGYGDDVIEISSTEFIPDAVQDKIVEITFFRDDIAP